MTIAAMTELDWAEFLKYPHLERFGNTEVEGIEHGQTFVFPKLDGTNGSIWSDGENVYCGSRNRVLMEDNNDNAGFRAAMMGPEGENYRAFVKAYPQFRLFGEWLVPHTMKGYRDDAWRKFYVFDVFDNRTGRFVPYNTYVNLLLQFDILFIPCYTVVRNGGEEHFRKVARECRFLLKDEAEHGEGVVIKNYDYFNRFGRVTWAKIVLDEFKELHVVAMGPNEVGGQTVEEKIADDCITGALLEKEYTKIFVSNESFWSSKDIPRLLETVYRCVVTEELYEWLKKNKNPDPVSFKSLRSHCIRRIKQLKPEIF